MRLSYLHIIMVFFCLKAIGQKNEVNFGVKTGLVFSKLTESIRNYDTQYARGFQIGGIVDYGLTDAFSIQGELLYTERGSISTLKVNADPNTGYSFFTRTVDIDLNYINLGVLGKYHFHQYLNLEFGAQGGYLLTRHLTYRPSWLSSNNETISLTNYRRVDLSLKLGFTYTHTSGVFINFSYDHGVVNLIDPNAKYEGYQVVIPYTETTRIWLGNNENLKNRGLYISLGYFFK